MRHFDRSELEIESIQTRLAALRHDIHQIKRIRAARKFDPDQPRVPAGGPEGGQWVGDSGATLDSVLFDPRFFALQRGLEAALSLFTGLSAQNSTNQQAVIAFNATEFRPGDGSAPPIVAVGPLTREQVDEFCPRFGDVQIRTNETYARIAGERPFASASQLGTAIHVDIKNQIAALADPSYRAEVSRLKSGDVAFYSERNSIRIDVLERVDSETVCVYDIKTGREGLTAGRAAEIAGTAYRVYGPTRRLVVTEVRPAQR